MKAIVRAGMRTGLLLLAVALCGFSLSQVEWGDRLEESVTDLLPSPGGAADAVLAERREAEGRLLLFVWEGTDAEAEAEDLVERLEGSVFIAEAGTGYGIGDPESLAADFFANRHVLLLPRWWKEHRNAFQEAPSDVDFSRWLAEETVARLGAFFEAPESFGQEAIAATDPLLLFLRPIALREELPGSQRGLSVWASLRADPIRAVASQAAVISELEQILAEWERDWPSVEGIHWSGALRFAEASRREMQKEVTWLNILSLGLVLVVGGGLLGSPLRLVHLLIPVAIGLLSGLTLVTLVFPQVHLLALVLGSVLAGVAIDYGTHLYLQNGKRVLVWRALLLSASSTIGGYLILTFSSLEVIAQAGVFVAGGLTGALVACALYAPLNRDRPPVRLSSRLVAPWFSRLPVGGRISIAVLAVLLGMVGLVCSSWQDDVRHLDLRHAELEEALEAVLGATVGEGNGWQSVIAVGPGILEAASQMAQASHQASLETRGIAALLPTPEMLREFSADADEWLAFIDRLPDALANEAFVPEAFADALRDFEEFHPLLAQPAALQEQAEQAAEELAAHFRGPSSSVIGKRLGDDAWLSMLIPADETVPAPLQALDVRTELNRLLQVWREEIQWLAIVGIVVVLLVLRVFFGWRNWARVCAVPLGSLVCALGFWGGVTGELQLFHLVAALLGFCVTFDYAVFFVSSAAARVEYPVSIRVSAMTTFVAFGVLAFSRIPAVSALGGTVALMVVTAIVALELMRPVETSS